MAKMRNMQNKDGTKGFDMDFLRKKQILKDGGPCTHPGCLHHATHPCEGCGRIFGISKKTEFLRKLAALCLEFDAEIEAIENPLTGEPMMEAMIGREVENLGCLIDGAIDCIQK